MIAELTNISKSYVNPGTNVQREVLSGIDLTIKSKDLISIVGPSGSGKSTLLNIIGTIDTPSSGKFLFKGQDVATFNEKQLSEVRRRSIGFVFQFHHLLPQLSLLENILVPTIPLRSNINGKDLTERAMELLSSVGLTARIHQRPGQLSGGECQRAALVRALINQPELILADEPTGSLDQDSAFQLGELLLDINRKHNVAMVVVTHSLTLAEKMIKMYRLSKGKLV
ncbi:MAG: ABC transporter ATP-binding protein [Tenuifilaceae bacterium]|jgi:ABC-type lipoprotein export system ATPase subunit|nr:ABC transporter ATP-binding protein [Tenuifilaceae bacterium]